MSKLTKQEMDYYESEVGDNLVFDVNDNKNVDYERQERISIMAQYDVDSRSKKRDRSSFNNDSEYKLYQLCVYDAALRAYNE